jgi:hypothetical protein
MKHIRTAMMFGAALAVASIAACSSSRNNAAPNGQTTPGNTEDGTGSVGFNYTIPGGEHISNVTYTLSNAAHTYTGTVNVGASSVISFVIPAVLAGTGYTLTISGTSDDGLVSCTGSYGTGVSDAGQNNGAPFTVGARSTTTVNVQLVCIDTANGQQGSVIVNGQASCCATWDTINANPSQALTTAPGNTSQLTGNASGPCDGDAGAGVNLNCTWTVITGTGTVTATTTDGHGNFFSTFTCPASGETDTLQLYCTDGPLPDGGFCPANLSTGTTTVTCGTIPCQGVGTGVEANPNTATGSCPAPSVNTGTLKDSSGNFCCSAGPCQGVGTGVEATPNTAAGTCPAGQGNTGTLKDAAGNFCCSQLAPCTTGTAGCVQCQGNAVGTGNNGGLCSATEQQFVAHDISTGKATAPGPDPSGSCYACLLGGGCLDDTQFADTGHECEDPVTTGTAAQCEAVISCILGSSCAASSVGTCYCGTAGISTTCQGNPAPGPINGACDTQIATGLGFPLTDGTDNTKNLTDTTRAAGKADQIFQCALSNACSACLH